MKRDAGKFGRGRTGALIWSGDEAPTVADETLVSTFFSDTWLTAQWEAFAMEPETDEAIEPLMRICELFSGCMTLHACQRHAERDDDCAIIGLAFDDVRCASRRFTKRW